MTPPAKPAKGAAAAAPALPDGNPKTAYGRLKPATFAIPPSALIYLGQVMQNGADKYGLFNWRRDQIAASVYFDAIQRHLADWRDGDDTDYDSGCEILAHVMACCAILLDARLTGSLTDDRGETGAVRSLIERLTKALPA